MGAAPGTLYTGRKLSKSPLKAAAAVCTSACGPAVVQTHTVQIKHAHTLRAPERLGP